MEVATVIHVEFRPAYAFRIITTGQRARMFLLAFDLIEGTPEEYGYLADELVLPGVKWRIGYAKDSRYFLTFDHRGTPVIGEYL